MPSANALREDIAGFYEAKSFRRGARPCLPGKFKVTFGARKRLHSSSKLFEVFIEKLLPSFLCGFRQRAQNTRQVVFDNRRSLAPFVISYPPLDLRPERVCRFLAFRLRQISLF